MYFNPRLRRLPDKSCNDFCTRKIALPLPNASKPDPSLGGFNRQLLAGSFTRCKYFPEDIPCLGTAQAQGGDSAGARRRQTGGASGSRWVWRSHGKVSAASRSPSRVISGQTVAGPSRPGATSEASPPVTIT